MRKLLLCLPLLLSACISKPTATVDLMAPASPAALVPLPAKAQWKQGCMTLNAKTRILYSGAGAQAEAEMLAAMLRPATGLPLLVAPIGPGAIVDENAIVMKLEPSLMPANGREGYAIATRLENGLVIITAATPAGLFYGGQTLRQLLPPAVFAATPQTGVAWTIPACEIQDQPRFAWRGFMLDYSRHWFGDVSYTKHLIDAMAVQKLNLLHMHLSDDEGWRIEIKKYPKLTEIGAWRGTECVLPPMRDPKDSKRYGGFFTQDDIREIVAYAAARHINIMPEIDLPGHSLTICTVYPETRPSRGSDEKSVQGFAGNAIDPSNEANYAMVDDIVGEIAALFPFDYVHIGGDEVNHNLWKDSPEIKALIEREKLGGLSGAQVYFTKRLEQILAKHHKKMIGWNEILNDRLERTTGIMSWTGTGPGFDAAKKGFPVVMAPGPHCYFDMGYPNGSEEPPGHSWAGQIDMARCYALDPLDGKGLPPERQSQILGVQACLWAEFITPWTSKSGWLEFKTSGEHADYKAFPRLCALAEIGWTPQALRSYDDFTGRLGPHLLRLKNAGVKLRLPPAAAVVRKGQIQILPPYAGAEIRYTVDGSDPLNSATAKVWDGQPFKAPAASLRTRTWLDGMPGPLTSGAKLAAAGHWGPKVAVGNYQVCDFDLTGSLDEPGIWRLAFRRTGGKCDIAIFKVELFVNDEVVAFDQHEGSSAGKGVYRFEVPTLPAGAKVVARVALRALAKQGEMAESSGDLTLDKGDGLEPEATVATAIGHYSNCTPDKMADYDRSTFFWTDRNIRKGDAVTVTFKAPVVLTSIEAVTGKLDDPTADILVDGVLEVSADGVTFRKVADFAYGAAKAELSREAIAAIRITSNADRPNWVVFQDLKLK